MGDLWVVGCRGQYLVWSRFASASEQSNAKESSAKSRENPSLTIVSAQSKQSLPAAGIGALGR